MYYFKKKFKRYRNKSITPHPVHTQQISPLPWGLPLWTAERMSFGTRSFAYEYTSMHINTHTWFVFYKKWEHTCHLWFFHSFHHVTHRTFLKHNSDSITPLGLISYNIKFILISIKFKAPDDVFPAHPAVSSPAIPALKAWYWTTLNPSWNKAGTNKQTNKLGTHSAVLAFSLSTPRCTAGPFPSGELLVIQQSA